MSRRSNNARLYIGNLPKDIRTHEIEDLFYKYGRIIDVDIKPARGSNRQSYAFIEFDDPRDAEDAVEGRDGMRFDGVRIRVEFSGNPRSRREPQPFRGPPKRTPFRVEVRGLPPKASWQDLKDHMRQAGPVGYANIEGGIGVVEFENHHDMEWALRHLDRSEFKNPFNRCEIRVQAEDAYRDSHRREYSQSRSCSRSRAFRDSYNGSYESRRPDKEKSPNRHSREEESPLRNREESPTATRRGRDVSPNTGKHREDYSVSPPRRQPTYEEDGDEPSRQHSDRTFNREIPSPHVDDDRRRRDHVSPDRERESSPPNKRDVDDSSQPTNHNQRFRDASPNGTRQQSPHNNVANRYGDRVQSSSSRRLARADTDSPPRGGSSRSSPSAIRRVSLSPNNRRGDDTPHSSPNGHFMDNRSRSNSPTSHV